MTTAHDLRRPPSSVAVLGTAALRSTADILRRPDVVKVVTADDGAAM